MVNAMASVLQTMHARKGLMSSISTTELEIEILAQNILVRNLRRLDVLTDGEVIEYHGPQVDLS
jgi:hypothetical protein